jgi:formamidopyrimidine-DNA glycosylase
MPELPEVETIRRDLAERIVGKKIVEVKVLDKKLGEAKNFARILIGNEIIIADRIGKLLIFALKSGQFLLVHLKMTGQLIYISGEKIIAGGHEEKNQGKKYPNKHTRFFLTFANGSQLFFNDLRRFGYVKIVSVKQVIEIKGVYGVEPLQNNFTLAGFTKALFGRRNIKAVLLDQKRVSGIGNIYADEILFEARVLPSRSVDSLKPEEIKRIHVSTEKILKKAIVYRGTTFSDYVDSSGKKGNFIRFLRVYGRKGEKCLVCGQPIKVAKIAGRSTHFCQKCQK